ncbi:MAG: glycosyltransferase [Thermacetogeniaceae bacterium]
MSVRSLMADSLIASWIRESFLYRLVAERAEALFLCLVVFLAPLIPVPASALLILLAACVFLVRGRLSLRRIIALPLLKWVAAFWFIIFLCSLFSVVPVRSLEVTILYGVFILFYLMCRIEAVDEAGLRLLVASYLGAVVVQSLIGLYQNYISVPLVDPSWVDVKEFPEIMVRVFGTLDNPNILAQYLVPGIVMAAALFLEERRPWARLLSLAAFGLASCCLYFTWSRGGILALLGALALFLLLYNRRLFMLALLLAILAAAYRPGLIAARFASVANLQDTSIAYRFIIWEIAWRIIKDFWFCGVGVGTDAFRWVYDRFYTVYGVVAMHTHDFYIELIVEIGVFGFILFLLMLGAHLAHGLRSALRMQPGVARAVAMASLAGLAGYLVQGITEQPWYNFRMAFLFWFLLSLVCERRPRFLSRPCGEGFPSLRALHIISDTNIGGAGRHLLNLLKHCASWGVDAEVACPEGSQLAPLCRELGVRVHELEELPPDASFSWKNAWRQIPALVRLIREGSFDVVHTHASFAGRLAAALAGAPLIVFTKHTFDPVPAGRGIKGWLRGLVNRATCDAAIAVSEAVRENLIRDGIPPERIEVIPNGVDLEAFRRSGVAQREWPGKYLVGVVARLSPEKGHRFFLEAARIIAADVEGVTFVIVGGGPLEGELKEYSRELGIGERVVFAGHRHDIPRVLEQLDVLVLPSLYEAQGLSLVEGMCMGVPCVATAVGGVPEVISDGVSGLLVEPGNPEALAAAVMRILRDPSLASRLGEAAQREARRFDARNMAKKVTDLYWKCYNHR